MMTKWLYVPLDCSLELWLTEGDRELTTLCDTESEAREMANEGHGYYHMIVVGDPQ